MTFKSSPDLHRFLLSYLVTLNSFFEFQVIIFSSMYFNEYVSS